MSNVDVSTTIQGYQPLEQVLNTDEYQKHLDEHNLAAANLAALRSAILKLEEILGLPLNRLTTTQKASIIDAINSILTENDFSAMIGNPELLTTTEKSNLVGAINELDFTKIDVSEFSAFVLSLIDLGSQSAFRTAIAAAAESHTHNANDINAGILGVPRIPELPASKVTSGTFNIDRIPQNPNNKEFATGDLTTLTTGQQSVITTSTRVITSDGRTWRWIGTGAKNDPANFVTEAAEILGTSVRVPAGPTSERPSGIPASVTVLRYNTTLLSWEGWNGTTWGKIGGGAATSATPPSPAQDGDLWWHPELGILFVYFDDGDSAQWVSTTSGADPALMLLRANNLSDLVNPLAARTALGLDDLVLRPGQRGEFFTPVAPSGWLKANGALVLRTAYADLDSAIYCGDANNATASWGYRTNSTDTVRSITGTHLRLPDGRGEFSRGWDDGRGVDAGRSFWSYQVDAFKDHTHSYTVTSANSSNLQTGSTSLFTIGLLSASNTGVASTGAGTETRPRNVAALVCIKY